MNLIQSLILMMTVLFASAVEASDISKVKDREGNTTAYIETDGSGTTRIRDKTWNTKGYIDSEGNIYDKEWNRKGAINND
jgi:hypothetical protein